MEKYNGAAGAMLRSSWRKLTEQLEKALRAEVAVLVGAVLRFFRLSATLNTRIFGSKRSLACK
ncbi:MAG: hypothetical protein J5942_03650 [Prevotella sp.]|nr:hypothetical protein [Prevotella sp.]